MKKWLVMIASVLVAGLVSVVVYFAIPKKEPVDLQVYVQDIVVKVGHSEEIEWTCNIEDALVVISSSNEKVVKIERVEGIDKAVGCKVGQAKLVVIGKYNGVKVQEEATVEVVEELQNSPETPSDEENSSSGNEDEQNVPTETPEVEVPNEDSGNSETDEGTEEEESQGADEELQSKLEYTKLINCELVDGKLILNESASYCIVQISLSEGIIGSPSFEYDTAKLSVSKVESMGGNVYKITVSVVGENVINVEIDGKNYEMVVCFGVCNMSLSVKRLCA